MHVTEGESVLLHVKVTGASKPTLVWYFEGKELQPDYSIVVADNSVTIPSTETRHAGMYKLVVTNTAGSVEKEVDDQKELRPVPVAEFGKSVEGHHVNGNKQFGKQYKVEPENMSRNKFKNIIACMSEVQ